MRAKRVTGSTITVSASEESHGVFEDLAELANLCGAHGAFFAGGVEVIVDAFFHVPFEQLNALFDAHFLRTATARLMQFVDLDELAHTSG